MQTYLCKVRVIKTHLIAPFQFSKFVYFVINCNDEVKEYEVGRTYNTNWEKRNAYRLLAGKPMERDH
jgi:hypothetical protein